MILCCMFNVLAELSWIDNILRVSGELSSHPRDGQVIKSEPQRDSSSAAAAVAINPELFDASMSI